MAKWGVGSCRVVLLFAFAASLLSSRSWRRRFGWWLAAAGAHSGVGVAFGGELLQELARRESLLCCYGEGRERERERERDCC